MSGAPQWGQRSWTRSRALGLLLLALLLAGGLTLRALRSRSASQDAHPVAEGRIAIPGIRAEVAIFRDRGGVPHVVAESEEDAFVGLGFVHAQDRLAQMLWMRRLAQGRSAERIGAEGVAADRLARTLDLTGLAEAELARARADTRATLRAYARGVNARIGRIRSGAASPPLELQLSPLPIEDWQPADSLALLKLFAWGLSGGIDVGLVLDDLIESLGGVGARRFFPRGDGDDGGPIPLFTPAQARPGGGRPAFRDPLRRAAGLEGHGVGSSAWVVGGATTAGGRPILVADLHVEPTAPSLFRLDHLSGGRLDVAGVMLPGVPIVWTGANPELAWASTHAGAVTSDLFQETLDPGGADRFHDGNGWRDLRVREETIVVRDGESVSLRVRATRHGPLIHELLGDGRAPLSVAWTGARIEVGSSVGAFLGVARARDAAALRRALRRHREPALALIYADSAGAAGVKVVGWLPRRSLETGLVPVPGRARWYAWAEPLAFGELPGEELEDGRGWLVAADNRFVSPESASRIEWLWRSGDRARRIEELLETRSREGPFELRGLATLQLDVMAPRGRALVARALELVGDPASLGGEGREIAALLGEWDGRESSDSVGAAAYHVFVQRLTESLLGPTLEPALLSRYLALPQTDAEALVFETLAAAAASGREGDDAAAPVRQAVHDSLRETWLDLSYRLGASRSKWTWGRLHPLVFRPLGSGGVRDGAARLGPFPYGGSGSSVNAAAYDPTDPFAVRVASTLRLAVDVAAPDQLLVALAPGQSEHPGHPHFSDGLAPWLEGRTRLLSTSRLVFEEFSESRLLLEPAP